MVRQVMLTSMNDVQDRIKGLDAGADDYIVKPFAPKELEARVRSLLRRLLLSPLLSSFAFPLFLGKSFKRGGSSTCYRGQD